MQAFRFHARILEHRRYFVKYIITLISYDIAEKDAFEYKLLWEKLEAIGATKILYSEWVVKGEVGKANDIYSKIAPLTQKKDRLLVQEVLHDAKWDKLLIDDAEFSRLLALART